MDNIEINQKKELQSKLWKMANTLRGNMDANEFKDYILGLIFYRYVCEHEEHEFNGINFDFNESSYQNDPDKYRDCALNKLCLGYFIEPKYLFKNLVNDIKNGTFELEKLTEAFENFSNSTKVPNSKEQLSKLFKDINLSSDKLGTSYKEKGELISKLITNLDEIDFNKFKDSEIDLLGDAYEYLISQFAASAGKKAGEFYTPQKVSKLLSLIVTKDITDVKHISDPTCGSGSLLIQVIKNIKGRYQKIYGQELNTTTCNLARMNLLIHKVDFEKFVISQGDVLKNPSEDQKKEGNMDIVVANPPFSAQWEPNSSMEQDLRFSDAGQLAPKSKADYAFVEHMIHSLSANGIMAIVLPHGPLFRGQSEGNIRKYLVEVKNYLDTVISLPEKLFYGTSIATTICIFKKNKSDRSIYFIDASKNFEKNKNQNILRDQDIEKILDAYSNKKEIPQYAHLATFEELKENDFNLNISRYVDVTKEEEPINLQEVMQNYDYLKKENQEITKQINQYLKELKLPEF